MVKKKTTYTRACIFEGVARLYTRVQLTTADPSCTSHRPCAQTDDMESPRGGHHLWCGR